MDPYWPLIWVFTKCLGLFLCLFGTNSGKVAEVVLKICPREVLEEIRLSRGAQSRGKVWLPEWPPVGKFPDNCPIRRVARVPTLCYGAVWGLPRDIPRANLKLQYQGGAAPKFLQPRVCPKDFQQLLRLPISWGLLEYEASLHTVL